MRAPLAFSSSHIISVAVVVTREAVFFDFHFLLFLALAFISCSPRGIRTRLEVASHHVTPSKHVASTRASNLELWLVDDDVFPHAAPVNHRTASMPPLALNRIRLSCVVVSDVLSPMSDTDVVNVQPLGTTCPPTPDHLRGRTGASAGFSATAFPRLRNLCLGLHSTAPSNISPLFLPESQKRRRLA